MDSVFDFFQLLLIATIKTSNRFKHLLENTWTVLKFIQPLDLSGLVKLKIKTSVISVDENLKKNVEYLEFCDLCPKVFFTYDFPTPITLNWFP